MVEIKPFIEHDKIISKVKELASEIASDNEGELHLVTVLKGAKTFADDLIMEILKLKKLKIKNDTITLRSYDATASSGEVKVVKDLDEDIEGKDVIIVEDIVDTGLTSYFLKNYLLKEKKAASVKLAALLDKPSRRKVDIEINYKGFEVPEKFIVGYGLDFNGKYRDLNYMGVLNEN